MVEGETLFYHIVAIPLNLDPVIFHFVSLHFILKETIDRLS